MTLKLTSFGELIAAKAAPRDNKTHRPCTFQVIKNHENLVFIIVNLLSSPSFLTLQNKKDPRHNQHFVEPTRYGTWEKNGREIDF